MKPNKHFFEFLLRLTSLEFELISKFRLKPGICLSRLNEFS